MRPLLVILTAALLALSTGASAQNQQRGHGGDRPSSQPQRGDRPADDPVVEFSKDDAELNAAIKAARETLPIFWTLFDTDPVVKESGLVKVAFPIRGGGNEHMWLKDLQRRNGAIYGTLDNIPAGDVGHRKGDRIRIDPEQITDWSYFRAGRMYGNYTTRVMVKHAPSATAEELLRVLSDRPLEGNDI